MSVTNKMRNKRIESISIRKRDTPKLKELTSIEGTNNT